MQASSYKRPRLPYTSQSGSAPAWNRLAHGAFAWCRRENLFATEVRVMKLSTMLLIATLGTASAIAAAGDKVTAEEFAKKAGAAGMAEVEMGKLGAQKATD